MGGYLHSVLLCCSSHYAPFAPPLNPVTIMTTIEAPASTSKPPAGPHEPAVPRKQMTKAERRELQEKQRAAKAAAASSKQTQASKPSHNQSTKQAKKDVTGTSSQSSAANRRMSFKADAQPSGIVVSIDKTDLEAQRRHQTRIFAHFAASKKEGRIGAGIKGEIHPAIVRLGRQFADMKIVGANARCIAMLIAFKTVRMIGRFDN